MVAHPNRGAEARRRSEAAFRACRLLIGALETDTSEDREGDLRAAEMVARDALGLMEREQ